MKKIFTLISTVLLSASLWAQAPQTISYQAIIRNCSNALVSSTSIEMKIILLQGSETGTVVYEETHTPTSNANGLVSIAIGGGKVVSGTFAKIDWANGPYFLKTETDPAGSRNYSLTTISQLLSVPYALKAKTTENIIGGNSGGGNDSFSHYIGEVFGGGVIFHLWKDTQGVEHGLVVANTEQSASQAWSNITNEETGQKAQSRRDGLSNNNAIVNQSGHLSSAAKLCLDLESGGQNDWYLPSIQELKMLWNNYFTVVKSLSQISGATQFASAAYWSSSEINSFNAWLFTKGRLPSSTNKNVTANVRAVRAF